MLYVWSNVHLLLFILEWDLRLIASFHWLTIASFCFELFITKCYRCDLGHFMVIVSSHNPNNNGEHDGEIWIWDEDS